jgi:hypothetical protein
MSRWIVVIGVFIVATVSFAWPVVGATSRSNPQTVTGDHAMAENIMGENQFWDLISKTTPYESNSERQSQALRDVLRELSSSDIEAFERAFQSEQRRAYTWNLWGAADVINGGASDDGFEYFQRWLISKGPKVFEAALADPDSLADMLVPNTKGPAEFEEFAYVASKVWAEKTGIDPWKDPQGRFPYTGAPPAASPVGAPFKEDSTYLEKRYPKLWARFGNSPLN